MTLREHRIYEMVIEYKQNQELSKDAKYRFFKEFGLLKEEKIEKNYDQLVKEEIERIKNKKLIYDKIKEKEKEEEKKEDEDKMKLISFVKRLIIFYFLSMILLFYIKYNNKRRADENMRKEIEINEQRRFANYVYVGNSKI